MQRSMQMPVLCDVNALASELEDTKWPIMKQVAKSLNCLPLCKTAVHPIHEGKQLFTLNNVIADFSLLKESE